MTPRSTTCTPRYAWIPVRMRLATKGASKKTRISIRSLLALFCFVKGLLQLRNIVIKQLEVVGDFLFSAHRRHQHDDPRAGFTGDGVRCFQIEVRFHGDDLDPFAFHQAHQLYRMLRAWGNAWPRLHVTNDVRSEEHTSELQSLTNFVCSLRLQKKNAHLCRFRCG